MDGHGNHVTSYTHGAKGEPFDLPHDVAIYPHSDVLTLLTHVTAAFIFFTRSSGIHIITFSHIHILTFFTCSRQLHPRILHM